MCGDLFPFLGTSTKSYRRFHSYTKLLYNKHQKTNVKVNKWLVIRKMIKVEKVYLQNGEKTKTRFLYFHEGPSVKVIIYMLRHTYTYTRFAAGISSQ
jgi:hypothetical protein